MEDVIKIFDPEGIKNGQYRKVYPELRSIPEFETLKDDELKIVWYYSNITSELVHLYKDTTERMGQSAMKVLQDNEKAKKFTTEFCDGVLYNNEDIVNAIERMKKVSPNIRLDAYKMLDKIFNDYNTMMDVPITDYKKVDGSLDYNAYVSVRQKIQAQLQKLVEQIELGFGLNKSAKERIGQDHIVNFLKTKQNAGNNITDLD